MCDAVAVMPLTVTAALTLRSSLIVTVALPVAVVVTAGPSLAPDNVTCWVAIMPVVWHPARTASAPASASKTYFQSSLVFIMIFLPQESWPTPGRRQTYSGCAHTIAPQGAPVGWICAGRKAVGRAGARCGNIRPHATVAPPRSAGDFVRPDLESG